MRRVALVTGSGKRRVGAAVAEELARRGYAVAVHYRTSEAEAADTVAELRGLGVEAEAYRADLGDEAAVKAMVAEVLSRFGRIDVPISSPDRFTRMIFRSRIRVWKFRLWG